MQAQQDQQRIQVIGRISKNVGAKLKYPLKPGDQFDCQDSINKWYPASVVEVKKSQVLVHYDGWDDRWDEWMDEKSDRIAPYGSKALLGDKEGEFNDPRSVCWTEEGDYLAVADTLNHRIQVFSRDGTFLRAFGSKGKEQGEFNRPYAVVGGRNQHRDCLVIADSSNDRIQIVSVEGHFVREGE
jgi:hypothetical protein